MNFKINKQFHHKNQLPKLTNPKKNLERQEHNQNHLKKAN